MQHFTNGAPYLCDTMHGVALPGSVVVGMRPRELVGCELSANVSLLMRPWASRGVLCAVPH